MTDNEKMNQEQSEQNPIPELPHTESDTPETGAPENERPAESAPAAEVPQSAAPESRNEQPASAPAPHEHVYTSYNAAPTPEKKKKAKRGGISAGAAVVLCVCCLLLSCASGFIGAHLAAMHADTTVQPGLNVPSDTTSSGSGSEKNPSVIYQSTDSPTGGMSSSAGSSSYYDVATAVKDSVVEITTEYLVNSRFQYVTSGAGSGIVLTKDGYILTNNHVITDTDSNKVADSITVRLTSGDEYKASVVGTDKDSDIAVIKIEAPMELRCAVIGNSDKLGVGEEVIAVGNPLGELGGTVTNGIISALNREIDVDGTTMNLLQTNAAINPGNSGGGLFNMSGELIGVVNAKSSGSSIEGLGFAIPVNEAISVAEQLMTKGYVSGKPHIGVGFYDVTNFSQALYYNLNGLGVYVVNLEDGYNDTVFQLGDRVIAVDDTEITSSSDIIAVVKAHTPGDTIKFSVYRKGKLTEVTATCYEYVPSTNGNVQFEQ